MSTGVDPVPVVFLHGIFGSTLVRKDTKELVYVSALSSIGFKTPDVKCPTEWELSGGELRQKMDDLVPGKVIESVGPVNVYGKFLGWLRETIGQNQVYPFAYDWRRDNRESRDKLILKLEEIKQKHGKKPIVIGHSNGGVVTFMAVNKRPELFHGAIFVGTPFGPGFGFMHDLHSFNQIGANKSILSAHVLMTHPCYQYFWGSGDPQKDQKCFPAPGIGTFPQIKNIYDIDEWKKHNLSVFGMKTPSGFPAIDEKFEQHLRNMLNSGKAVREHISHNPEISYPPIAVVASKSHKTKFTLKVARKEEKDVRSRRERDPYPLTSNSLDWELIDGDNRVAFHLARPPIGVPVVDGGIIETTMPHGELTSDLEAMRQAIVKVYEHRQKGSTEKKKLASNNGTASTEINIHGVPTQFLVPTGKCRSTGSMCVVC